jgi:hypothetical protein
MLLPPTDPRKMRPVGALLMTRRSRARGLAALRGAESRPNLLAKAGNGPIAGETAASRRALVGTREDFVSLRRTLHPLASISPYFRGSEILAERKYQVETSG